MNRYQWLLFEDGRESWSS